MGVKNDPLRIIVTDNFWEFGKAVDEHLKRIRNVADEKSSYLVPIDLIRFSSGEGKVVIKETVRAKDIFILSDVTNYSITYQMHGFENHMSPDDHYQDLKRIIGAINAHSSATRVIMPFLYESRQHRRKERESLDCAMALRELENQKVDGIITFDTHDPNVQNALQLSSFDNVYPTYQMLNQFIEKESIDPASLLVVSPDVGAFDRARFYADMLACDVGIYHKRRDFSKIVEGKNPIVAHEYLGASIKEKNIIIVDDMISSGQSIIEVAEELKKRGANQIFLMVTFALFSDGQKSIALFDKAYKKGYFDRLYATNLSYVPQDIKKREWYEDVDCSELVASIIDILDKQQSMGPLLNRKIHLFDQLHEVIK